MPRDRIVEGPLEDRRYPRLEPLASLGRNGMRVSISPSFGDYSFVVDFIPQPFNCYLIDGPGVDEARFEREGCGWIVARYTVLGRNQAPPPSIRRYNFFVPEEEFRAAVGEFNRLAADWEGTHLAMLDGTNVGVEQFREARLRSMSSNTSAAMERRDPAARLGLHVHRLLLAFGPTGAVPRNGGFTVSDAVDYPCMAQTFEAPDPDGLGAGADPCAQELAESARR